MNGFKRLAVYFTVLVGCLFVGLTTYYLVKNYEFINVKADSELDAVYVNVGETIEMDFTHDLKQTELECAWSEEGLAEFNVETGELTGLKAGETQLTITAPENDKFGPFVFTVRIGNGEYYTPYYIKNQDDLQAIGGTRVYSEENAVEWSPAAYYKLVADIQLEGEFTPLCQENSFTGSLEGQLKTISNLTITENQLSAGLFSQIGELATVTSIIFENPVIDGRFDFAGVVAGASWASNISLIEVKNGTVKAAPCSISSAGRANVMTGGIVGASQGVSLNTDDLMDRGIITSCTYQGVVGTNDSVNEVIESAKVSYFSQGGIVGYALGSTVYNTKAVVNFDIDSIVAAKAGEYQRGTTNPEGVCYQIGGIAGEVGNLKDGQMKDVDGSNPNEVKVKVAPIIRNNLAIVDSNVETTSVGGVVGHLPINVQSIANEQWVVGNYFFTDGLIITEGGSIFANATTRVLSRADLSKKETYVVYGDEKWDIGDLSAWIIEEGKEPSINLDTMFSNELRFEVETIEISTEDDFVKYYNYMNDDSYGGLIRRYYLKQSYVLKTDIDFAALIESGKLEKFEPIGGNKFAFEGVFDGNGKTIKLADFQNEENTDNDQYKYNAVGLFAQLGETAEVKNLTVANIKVNKGFFVGGITGVNYGKINNCFVVDLEIREAIYAGAIAGINYGTIIGNIEAVEAIKYYKFIIDDNEHKIDYDKTTVTDFVFEEHTITDEKFTIENVEYTIDWDMMTVSYIENTVGITENKFTANDVEYVVDWENSKATFGEKTIEIVEGKFAIGEMEYTVDSANNQLTYGEGQTVAITDGKFTIGEGETTVIFTIDLGANKVTYGKQTAEISNNSFTANGVTFSLNKDAGIVTFGSTIEVLVEEENGDWSNISLGNITNSTAFLTNSILIAEQNRKAYAGTITGINHGTISGIVIPGTFEIEGTEVLTGQPTRVFGGLVGYNTGRIENTFGYNIHISDPSTTKTYMGGLVGINSGSIVKCSVGGEMRNGGTASQITGSLNEGEQVAGGFAAIMTETSVVESSFALVGIECNIAAGFAPYLFGSVSQSYVGGQILGNEVGGFAVHMLENGEAESAGRIIDCYTCLNLSGSDKDAIVAGFSVFVRYPATIERSIMSCTFGGNGTWYYESLTNTREGFMNWVNSWMQKDQRLGTITNVIINIRPSGTEVGEGASKHENTKVQESKALISYKNQVAKYLTAQEIAELGEDEYKQLGFLINWDIEKTTIAILKSVEDLHGKTQVPSQVL